MIVFFIYFHFIQNFSSLKNVVSKIILKKSLETTKDVVIIGQF